MKKLMTVAVLLAALIVAAAPAFGQVDPYPEEDLQPPPEISITGELQESVIPEEPALSEYILVEEGTNENWTLLECGQGAVNNLGDFVGQTISVTGVPQTFGPVPDPIPESFDFAQFPLCVSSIETVGEPEQGEIIYGTSGSDYLTDTAGNDIVYALGSGDTISSGNGDDELYGGPGWDYVVGGYGNDTLYGWTGSDWLDGGAGDDYVSGWEGDDLVDGGTGDDEVYGGVGDDAVYGYEGSDTLYGWTGNDFMYSAGDDTYDVVYAWTGYDVCVVGPEDDAYGCEELYRQ